MKKPLIGLAILVAGSGAAWYLSRGSSDEAPSYRTARAERGNLLVTVTSTGTLQAVTTVQVGTQISGVVSKLFVDFNDRVKEGQVVAQLDPDLLQVRLSQDQASLLRAEAGLSRLQVDLDEARRVYNRQKELFEKKIASESDLDTSRFGLASAEAQLNVAQAEVYQARAAVLQSEINLKHATITSPISGLVISRSVDVGQTVAASLSAPTLFTIANDLSKMWVLANVDEADVGRVQTGQDVSFTVDSFAEREFKGRVRQIRLQPTTVQNVVMYTVVVDVENPEGILLPGMTANLSILVDRAEKVLRVPNAALRFSPWMEGSAPSFPPQGAAGGGPRPTSWEGMKAPSDGRSASREGASGRSGKVYVLSAGVLKPTDVNTGRTDGAFTEIVSGGLAEGDEVVVGLQAENRGSAAPARAPWGRR